MGMRHIRYVLFVQLPFLRMKRVKLLAVTVLALVLASTVPVPAPGAFPLLAVPKAEAAHPENFGCNNPTVVGDSLVQCWYAVVRPVNDTGGQYGNVASGVFHYPAHFPGINSLNNGQPLDHGYTCTHDVIGGTKRFFCTGRTPVGGRTPIDFMLHVRGSCGESFPVSVVVAQPYGYPAVHSTITFPACPLPPAPVNNGTCEIAGAPDTVVAGQQFNVTFSLSNTGTKTWIAGSGVNRHLLMSNDPIDNSIWGTGRIGLPGNIGAGGSVGVTKTLTAPATAGSYIFSWQLGEEGVARFGSVCRKQITVTPPAPCTFTRAQVLEATVQGRVQYVREGNTSVRIVNDTDCSFPITNETFRLVGTTDNQFLFSLSTHTVPKRSNQSYPFAIPQNCGFQNDVFYGTYSTALGTHISQVPEAVNHLNTGLYGYVEGAPCSDGTDLSVQKTGPSTLTAGQTASYRVTVSNLGTSAAQGVRVTDAVPSGLTFSAQGSDPACGLQGSSVICPLGTLAAGQSRTLTVAFASAACTPVTNSFLTTNVATVTATTADPNSANNISGTVHTAVQCAPLTSQCSNGRDDDNDGRIDAHDPGCHTDGNP